MAAEPLSPEDRLAPHDLGCKCWPHVSQRDAVEAVVEAARREYDAARAATPAAPEPSVSGGFWESPAAPEALREAAQSTVDFWETEGEVLPLHIERLRAALASEAKGQREPDPDEYTPDFECYCGAPDPGTDGVCRSCNGATYRIDPDLDAARAPTPAAPHEPWCPATFMIPEPCGCRAATPAAPEALRYALSRIQDIVKPISVGMDGPRWDSGMGGGGNKQRIWEICEAALAAATPPAAPEALRELEAVPAKNESQREFKRAAHAAIRAATPAAPEALPVPPYHDDRGDLQEAWQRGYRAALAAATPPAAPEALREALHLEGIGCRDDCTGPGAHAIDAEGIVAQLAALAAATPPATPEALRVVEGYVLTASWPEGSPMEAHRQEAIAALDDLRAASPAAPDPFRQAVETAAAEDRLRQSRTPAAPEADDGEA